MGLLDGFLSWMFPDYYGKSTSEITPPNTPDAAAEVGSVRSPYDPFGVMGEHLITPWDGNADQFNPLPVNSPLAVRDVQSIKDSVPGAKFDDVGFWESLFETAEQAAVRQAQRNEEAAVAAYQRSEAAADAALRRARELRQTEKQDVMASLKAAGLNPVLAASGGFSGSAVTAPQATAPSSSSGMASGVNGADLLSSIASIVSSAGNLMKGISSFLPTHLIKG